ncbi:hypothetical protein I5907_09465 [Panacibacter sp. DH6]|uniref:Uncharacterized protein n=1 Tax=Panacibacter microcysteis TaxID=2793269 RepID=A0A931E719_9BACT|nr:hypothetical protein [Panacibacter microcysteis]MBG9376460.1 hypothetical protein [Panacibacter microcysteis]
MKTMLLALLCYLSTIPLNAQTEEFRVKAGDDITTKISEHGKYRFTAFKQGRIYYDYGKSASAKFNYNYLVEEMQFINPDGDTLSIANPEQVKYVVFDSAIYYYNEGFIELVKNLDSVKIGKKQKLKIVYEKIGAYGQPTNSSAIDNNKFYLENNTFYRLTINQDAIIKKQTTWYIISDKEERPVEADKAGFTKLFPQHKDDIKVFTKENNDALKTADGLARLLSICMK